LKAGEPVMAIGSPQGLQGSVTAGVVSAIRDDPFSGGFKVIQTDAAANPGNSGGPLLNSKGQVVGVVTSRLRSSEGLNFAVPINYVRGLMSANDPPLVLTELRAKLSTGSESVFKNAEGLPTDWKSMITGNRFKIRKEGDAIYIERVASQIDKQVGNFEGIELHKSNDGYSGKEHLVLAVNYFTLANKRVDKRCTFDFPAEISLLTPSRIEGRLHSAPAGAKLDYRKCSYDKTEWRSFVWIPE